MKAIFGDQLIGTSIFGSNLYPASICTQLKALQEGLEPDSDKQPRSGYSFRVGAAFDLLEQGKPF